MSLPTVIFMVVVFFFCYRGMEFLLENRDHWPSAGTRFNRQTSGGALREWIGKLGGMGLNKWILSRPKYRAKLDILLVRSGHVFGWRVEDLLLFKELGTAAAAFVLWHNDIAQPLYWIGGLYLGSLLPEIYVKLKGAERQAEIQRHLPGFIDLIALAMESGLDLLAGIDRIVGKMKVNALRDELQLFIQENQLGTPRKEALQHLAYRVNLPDIQSLTSLIIQSEELGTGLSVVLRNYTEDMRSRRISRAEEIAGKAPVKLLFPMMVFFFPIVFVIIFGPLALSFMNGYK